MRELIDVCLAELDEQDRELVIQRFYHGQTQAELGDRFNISQQYAHVRIKKAIDQLRKSLKRRGVTLSTSVIGAALSMGLAEASLPAAISAALVKIGLAGVGTAKLSATVSASTIAKATLAVVIGVAAAAWVTRSESAATIAPPSTILRPTNSNIQIGEQAFRHVSDTHHIA